MSYLGLSFGLIQKDKQTKLDLPKKYAASQYMKRLPCTEMKIQIFKTRSLIWLITELIFKITYLLRAGMKILSKKNQYCCGRWEV